MIDYSIVVQGVGIPFPVEPGEMNDFDIISEGNNIWIDGRQAMFQLDRVCGRQWQEAPVSRVAGITRGLHLNAVDSILNYPTEDLGWAVVVAQVCRKCVACSCSSGLHIWNRAMGIGRF